MLSYAPPGSSPALAGFILAGQFCGIKIAVLPPGHEGKRHDLRNQRASLPGSCPGCHWRSTSACS